MDFKNQDTTMGGNQCIFRDTHWSVIMEAQSGDLQRQQSAVDQLIKYYWKPIYCFLRQRGYDNDASKDLTQGFFQEIVIERKLLVKALPTKGSFRKYLLKALEHFIISSHRKNYSQKRHPRLGFQQLDTSFFQNLPQAQALKSPDKMFCYTWATEVLSIVLQELKKEYYSTHRQAYWDLFQQRIISPILNGEPELSLADIAEDLGVENSKKASNMLITVKRRFATVLRRVLARDGISDSEVDEEIFDFIRILSQ